MCNRRVSGVVLAALLGTLTCFAADTLRSAAAARGILIGAAVDPRHFDEPDYAATLAREFSQIQPENAMKMKPVEGERNVYDFRAADAIVAFAAAHDMKVRGHTLVWHEALPTWLATGTFAPAEVLDIMQTHIRTEVAHFAGRVYAWDVLNEAITKEGAVRSDLYSDRPGTGVPGKSGYIEEAFRTAREADPKALLFYNDYDTEVSNPKSDAIYEMVRSLLSDGVPISGVGFQCHLDLKGVSRQDMIANLRRFVDLGIQVQITELDVRVPVDADGNAKPEDLEQEARVYADVAGACLAVRNCTAIQMWGFTDRYSWIPHSKKGFGAGLPFDADYRAKPAWRALLETLTSKS